MLGDPCLPFLTAIFFARRHWNWLSRVPLGPIPTPDYLAFAWWTVLPPPLFLWGFLFSRVCLRNRLKSRSISQSQVDKICWFFMDTTAHLPSRRPPPHGMVLLHLLWAESRARNTALATWGRREIEQKMPLFGALGAQVRGGEVGNPSGTPPNHQSKPPIGGKLM